MASLKDLQVAKDQTEASAWMTVRFWEGTAKAGEPIQSGDGKAWRILIRNAYCHAYQTALQSFNWQRQLRLKLESLNGDGATDNSNTAIAVTEEFLHFEKKEFREYLILDWENLFDDGEVVQCSPANIKTILFEQYPQIFDQVKAFAYDGRNFGMKDEALVVASPADLVGDIEKKALNGCDGDVASSSASAPPMEDSVTPTMTSSDSQDKASLPALA